MEKREHKLDSQSAAPSDPNAPQIGHPRHGHKPEPDAPVQPNALPEEDPHAPPPPPPPTK